MRTTAVQSVACGRPSRPAPGRGYVSAPSTAFLQPPSPFSRSFSPSLPASGSGGRVVFSVLTTSVPFIPSAAWSPTVQRNSYVPGPSVAWPEALLPGAKIGVPPRSWPSFSTWRSCARAPLLRSTKRTTEGLLVPALTVTFFGSKEYSSAPNAIGWLCPTVTLSFFWPPSPFLSSPPPQPASASRATKAAGRGLSMSAGNMPATAEAEPLPRLLPRGLRRARKRLREPRDQGGEQRVAPGGERRRPLQRALLRLPHARCRG